MREKAEGAEYNLKYSEDLFRGSKYWDLYGHIKSILASPIIRDLEKKAQALRDLEGKAQALGDLEEKVQVLRNREEKAQALHHVLYHLARHKHADNSRLLLELGFLADELDSAENDVAANEVVAFNTAYGLVAEIIASRESKPVFEDPSRS